jgi:GT2 family glycosyltransferase
MNELRRAWTLFRARPALERRQLIRRALRRLRDEGPAATLRWVRGGGAMTREPARYRGWCLAQTPDSDALAAMRIAAEKFAHRPTISIITAVYNTDPRWLEAAAESVLAQVYDNWQWSIADDASTDARTTESLARLSNLDPRIVVQRAAANGGISAASNLALSAATGEFVALMDHDDALLPHALFRIVERLNGGGEPPDVIYSDEDKLDERGERVDPYFKPDWSPDLFRSSMYACHLLVIRRSLVEEVGAFRTAFDFAQDYDLLLRVVERTSRIAHVPDVLYHWRKIPASAASSGDAKPTAHRAGAAALQAHLDRQGISGRILDAGPPGLYRVRYDIAGEPRVTIVVPTRGSDSATLQRMLDQLRSNTAYSHFDAILVSPDGVRPRVPDGLVLQTLRAEGPFNFAAWVNQGARASSGEHILVLQDDVEPLEPEWLTSMLELSSQPWVGAVGAKLFDSGGALQHIGLVLGLNGLADSPFRGFAGDTVGYFSGANCIRNYSAVSTACLMTRRDVFERVGGFDAALTGPGSDVDYGLRVGAEGFRVVYTPYARLTHRGTGGLAGREPSTRDRARLIERWGDRLHADPMYNENLSAEHLDYRVK